MPPRDPQLHPDTTTNLLVRPLTPTETQRLIAGAQLNAAVPDDFDHWTTRLTPRERRALARGRVVVGRVLLPGHGGYTLCLVPPSRQALVVTVHEPIEEATR
ncbi:MAG: hypothetical protein ACRDJN_18395 [Chloroflexota bacterium]